MDIALESGAAFSGEGFQYIKPALAEHTLHFIGLLSDGGEPGGGFRVQGYVFPTWPCAQLKSHFQLRALHACAACNMLCCRARTRSACDIPQ